MSVYPGCRALHVLLFEVYTKISKKTLNNFYICRSSLCDIAFYLFSKALQRCLGFFTGVSSISCVLSVLFCLFLTVHRCDYLESVVGVLCSVDVMLNMPSGFNKIAPLYLPGAL